MPMNEYLKSDPSFTLEHEEAWARISRNLNDILKHSVRLNASIETLQNLESETKALVEKFQEANGERAIPAWKKFSAENPAVMLPYSPATGQLNAMAVPDIQYEMQGNKVVATMVFSELYEGPPDSVHGGIIAHMWDQVLAFANTAIEAYGFTANLSISYRQPTPINKTVRFEAEVEKTDGYKTVTKGTCYHGDTIVSQVEGLFVNPNKRK